MTLTQAKQIVDLINQEVPSCSAELREEYSGRGMYGHSVPAIVVENAGLVTWAGGKLGMDWNDLPQCTDNMGCDDVVVY
jgi:hypothetical protein